MNINCLACGHKFELDEAYDDYEGPVRCWVCGALLDIKAQDGSLRRMAMFKPGSANVRGALQDNASVRLEV
jgi:DNA-directed RNA polymerase subunit RPC12/RpoP